MILLTTDPIDANQALARIDSRHAGSVVFHLAVVKADAQGQPSKGIVFQDKGGLAAELEQIEKDLRADFAIADVILVRRLGNLAVGDAISLAVVSAPGRDAAFGACREAVERFKKMKAIAKTEILED
jgi:molybdopterin synthase catalytic subunit